MKSIICSKNAPAALGPYSQAVKAGNILFLSGQLGINPATGELAQGVEAQTKQALENLKAVLAEAGATPANVCKTTVFLTDINDFQAVNAIYAQTFATEPPARSCVQIAALPKGACVEIELIAAL
ncbi:MAG: RidA family protein [Desulfovibrionaceae bacterium]|nr:RidA family protein [Desulfovibrionaceae bacterium]